MEYQTKSKKFKNIGKIFTIIMTILTISLTLTMADLFSSLITVGGFSFTSDNLTLSKYNLYAVYTNSLGTKVQAEENSNICKMQGGGGYIYLTESKFFIIASIYENEADATKVLQNLKNSYTSAGIIPISILPISISSNLSINEKDTLESALNVFKNTYKKLYDISVSLDTAVINEINARLSINSIGSEISTICSNFTTIFNTQMTNNFLNIKLKLNELSSAINSLINSSTKEPFTSQIKYTYSTSLFIYKSLAESLTNS